MLSPVFEVDLHVFFDGLAEENVQILHAMTYRAWPRLQLLVQLVIKSRRTKLTRVAERYESYLNYEQNGEHDREKN